MSRLGRMLDVKPVMASQVSQVSQPPPVTHSALKEPVAADEGRKKEGSPWMLIRGDFTKSYDLKKENTLALISNPFGNSAVRKEEQLRGASNLLRSQKGESTNTKQIEIRTYLAMLEDHRKELRARWEAEDKVMALQLTIQATKLLHDTEKAVLLRPLRSSRP